MTSKGVPKRPNGSPLFGREHERARLSGVIAAAKRGHLEMALIEGEAGIGKTRLLEEVLRDCRRRGFRIFRGVARELERERPFGPLAEALDLDRRSPDPERADIGRLLTGDIKGTPGPAVEVGYAVVERILGLLQQVGGQRPVALALEDLHWSDSSTLRALGSIGVRLRDLPLLVLATFRPFHDLGELDRLVDAFTREGAAHVRLGPLDGEAVAALAKWVAGAPPEDELLRQLSRAAGNPLFVKELIEALRDDGALRVSEGRATTSSLSLPGSLRLTILRRLSALPKDTVDLLRVCSVLGPTFPVAHLCAVKGTTAVELLPHLDDALRAGVLEGRGDDLSFRHELIRAAIYDDLPVAVRKQLHREAGRTLAAAGTTTSRVAEHFFLGASTGDEEAVTWLRRAGVEAASRSAPVAAELLERALTLAGEDHPERDALRAEMAPLLVLAGRIEDSETAARDLLARRPEPALEVRLRVGLAHVLVRRGRWRTAREQIERAAARLPEPTRRGVMAAASFISFILGDVSRAVAEAQAARAVAERQANEVLLSTALMTLTGAADSDGRLDEAVELGRAAVAAADRAETPFAGFLFPELMLGAALAAADRFDEAEKTVRAGVARAERLGTPSVLTYYHAPMMTRHFYAGRWDDALGEAEASLVVGQETDTSWFVQPSAIAARIHIEHDDLPAATRVLDDADEALRETDLIVGGRWLFWARALLLEAGGEPTEKVATVMARAWDALPDLKFAFGNWAPAIDAVRIALAAGDRARAALVTEELDDFAERAGTASARGAARRCRGLVDRDSEVLLDAVEIYRQSPRPMQRALALEDAAGALVATGQRQEGRALFEEALNLYSQAGAIRSSARTLATMRALGIRRGTRGPRRRPATGWEALSPTELSVAGLVAEGLTNPRIAERLFVSRYTVESHLKRIFAKLGLKSRAELAAEVVRRGRGAGTGDPDGLGSE